MSSEHDTHGHGGADLDGAKVPIGAVENTKALGLTFIAMTFGVLLVIVVLSVYFKSHADQLKAQREDGWDQIAGEALTARRDAQAQLELSGGARWLDVTAGTVQLPESEARRAVIASYAGSGTR